jgi:hypothetical protein
VLPRPRPSARRELRCPSSSGARVVTQVVFRKEMRQLRAAAALVADELDANAVELQRTHYRLTSRFPTGFGSMPGTNIGRRCTLSRRLIPTCGTRCEALTPSSYRGEKTSFQRRRLWKMLRDACGISRKAIFPSRRPLRGQRNRSRSFQRKAQASQHREVSVKPDTFQAAHPERRKAVVIFQAPNSRSTAPRPR